MVIEMKDKNLEFRKEYKKSFFVLLILITFPSITPAESNNSNFGIKLSAFDKKVNLLERTVERQGLVLEKLQLEFKLKNHKLSQNVIFSGVGLSGTYSNTTSSIRTRKSGEADPKTWMEPYTFP